MLFILPLKTNLCGWHEERHKENGITIKKNGNESHKIEADDMLEEYHFDYNKAQPNRFCRSNG